MGNEKYYIEKYCGREIIKTRDNDEYLEPSEILEILNSKTENNPIIARSYKSVIVDFLNNSMGVKSYNVKKDGNGGLSVSVFAEHFVVDILKIGKGLASVLEKDDYLLDKIYYHNSDDGSYIEYLFKQWKGND